MKYLVSLIACLSLAGCAGTVLRPDSTGVQAAKLTVTYGVLKFVEKAGDPTEQYARAQRIKTITEDVKKYAAGDEVTLSVLQTVILQRLPPTLSPADKGLALGLVELVMTELRARMDGGVIKPEQLVAIDTVAGWIISATGLVSSPG